MCVCRGGGALLGHLPKKLLAKSELIFALGCIPKGFFDQTTATISVMSLFVI